VIGRTAATRVRNHTDENPGQGATYALAAPDIISTWLEKSGSSQAKRQCNYEGTLDGCCQGGAHQETSDMADAVSIMKSS